MKGVTGGAWDRATHQELYGVNLNTGLGDFIAKVVQPRDLLEFGAGLGGLADYIASHCPLGPSFCLEPEVVPDPPLPPALQMLNVDVLSAPAPRVLDRLFDLVLSIEVAEHVPLERHEALFDFLVARAGRLIVFSGARPGQGGHGHVAERPELEWRAEFTRRGCRFDPALTLRARSLSSARNINHRRNLQVFHAPPRSAALLALEDRARPYLQDLLTLVLRAKGPFTGNLFYVDLDAACAGRPEHSLHWKRENLTQIAAGARHVLEIGFAAGHSALIFLLANPHSHLTIVDPLDYPHSRACFDYLSSQFPGRLTLVPGYSTDVLPGLAPGAFDVVHLDGGKDLTIAQDLDLLQALVATDHVLCIDDTQNPGVQAEVSRRLASGALDAAGFEPMNEAALQARWTHVVLRYGARTVPLVENVLSDMAAIYRTVAHPSIYTAPGLPGRPRAEYLINALRAVEAARLDGAFVELGVAAGHSSVIAALASSRRFPRDFYLYDTFRGFDDVLPDEKDHLGVSIRAYDLTKYAGRDCSAPVVRRRLGDAGIPDERLFLIEGPGEETIPQIQPPSIAILRLDADLFAPTLAAFEHLYDRVPPGGFVIVDDYGHWKGCSEATNLFFAERGLTFPGERIDYTCYGWRKT